MRRYIIKVEHLFLTRLYFKRWRIHTIALTDCIDVAGKFSTWLHARALVYLIKRDLHEEAKIEKEPKPPPTT